MNKLLIAAMVGAVAFSLAGTSLAQRGGGGGHAGGGAMGGGGHTGGGSYGGSGGAWHGGGSSGAWHGGTGYRGGYGYGYRGGYGYGYRGWYGWPYYGYGLALGAAFGYPWYYPYYGYYGAAYPYAYPYGNAYPAAVYTAPGGAYDPGPTNYVQRDPGYRYYCRDPGGFYPDVSNCSSGWLKVLPDASAQPGQTQ